MEVSKRISRIRLMALGEKHGRFAKEMGLRVRLISPSSRLKVARVCRVDFMAAGKKLDEGFPDKIKQEE